METHLSENASVWDSSIRSFISTAHQRLAEILNDYNPYFSLVFIPPADRDVTDTKPFAILDSSPGRPKHIIRYLSEREMQNPAEIIGWIFNGDMSKHRPVDVLQRIENERVAAEMLNLKAKEEEAEARENFAEFIFGEGLGHAGNFMKHNGQTYRR